MIKIYNPALLFFIVFGVVTTSFGADPSDLNCDFEKGMGKWRGDGSLYTDAKGNKVCELKKTGKRTAEINHKMEVKGRTNYEVEFKVRAVPGGENIVIEKGFKLQGEYGLSMSADLKADGEWVTQKISIKPKEGARRSSYTIIIRLDEGKGKIEIDDIKVTAKE